jgi:hypothetical protein
MIDTALCLLRCIRRGAVTHFLANSTAMSYASVLHDAGLISLECARDVPGDVYRVAKGVR